MPSYELYKKDVCPYCQKVMKFMKENHVEGVVMKDIIEDPKNQEDLVKRGGMAQVPCLFIDGDPLYESDDIIQYMKEYLVKGEAHEDADEDPGVCNVL
ncbi:glutathione S-transferase N-terminal domain-containing protein [uncultured Levyella sp.]|uniref:glutaredoxin family protein n=1 Tax=uncultured Levyella sp. TaxID=1715800 RepID=UPI002586203E|nr:glutathione S-transferase N-terminal domain-containing protein [uncultured Levyella sp.]